MEGKCLVTVEITEAELQADRDATHAQVMRERRGFLLAETDYLFFSDRPAASQAMIDYRQALRDLPESDGWPTNITWPERPAS